MSEREREKEREETERRERVSERETYGLLCEDHTTQQLILQAFHGDGEINDGSSCRDLGGVGRVGHLGGDVQSETFHDIALLVSDLHLQCAAHLLRKYGRSVETK